MSKLIKLEQCITALPCKLEPIELQNFLATLELAQADTGDHIEAEVDQSQQAATQAELILKKARTEAAELVAKANQEAIRLIEDAKHRASETMLAAQKEAQQLRETANREGYQTGQTVARQEFRSTLVAGIKLIETIEEEWQARLQAAEAELLRLAVAIAAKLIEAELILSKTTQLEIVRAGLQRLAVAPQVNLRVAPESLSLFVENLSSLQTVSGTSQLIQLQADSNLSGGDFYLESSQGNLDLRIQTQLELVLVEFLKLRQ